MSLFIFLVCFHVQLFWFCDISLKFSGCSVFPLCPFLVRLKSVFCSCLFRICVRLMCVLRVFHVLSVCVMCVFSVSSISVLCTFRLHSVCFPCAFHVRSMSVLCPFNICSAVVPYILCILFHLFFFFILNLFCVHNMSI